VVIESLVVLAVSGLVNSAKATTASVYWLLSSKPDLAASLSKHPELCRKVWKTLSTIAVETLMEEGRVYGRGLHKLEPKELANVPADSVLTVFPEGKNFRMRRQMELFA
jgi:adenine-specific DNA-methyltransferase